MIGDDKLLAYRKASMTVPAVEGHYAAAANVFFVLLSLKRHVTLNFMRMALMLEEKQRLQLKALEMPGEDDVLVRDDPIEDIEELEAGSYHLSTEDEVRILEKCKEARHPASVVTERDWEKLLIDDVKEERRKEHAAKKQRVN